QKPFTGACSRCGRKGPEARFGVRYRRGSTGRVAYWRTTCDDCINHRKRLRDRPEGRYGMKRSRIQYLRSHYNFTPEQYVELWYSQGECCAICRTESSGGRWWHLDHDHSCCPGKKSCGKCVRAILCHGC